MNYCHCGSTNELIFMPRASGGRRVFCPNCNRERLTLTAEEEADIKASIPGEDNELIVMIEKEMKELNSLNA